MAACFFDGFSQKFNTQVIMAEAHRMTRDRFARPDFDGRAYAQHFAELLAWCWKLAGWEKAKKLRPAHIQAKLSEIDQNIFMLEHRETNRVSYASTIDSLRAERAQLIAA